MTRATWYPMIVIEVPHQMPVRSHVIENEDDLLELAFDRAGDNYDWGRDLGDTEVPNYDECITAIRHDLNSLIVIDNVASARERIAIIEADGGTRGAQQHQGFAVVSAIRRECARIGWIL